MTQTELSEIVDAAMSNPRVSACIAGNFREDRATAEGHREGGRLTITWQDRGDCRRCTIVSEESAEMPVARIDLGEDATVRLEAYVPCRVTVSNEEGFLCLSRPSVC